MSSPLQIPGEGNETVVSLWLHQVPSLVNCIFFAFEKRLSAECQPADGIGFDDSRIDVQVVPVVDQATRTR